MHAHACCLNAGLEKEIWNICFGAKCFGHDYDWRGRLSLIHVDLGRVDLEGHVELGVQASGLNEKAAEDFGFHPGVASLPHTAPAAAHMLGTYKASKDSKTSPTTSNLRPSILDLADKFKNSGGWGLERAFSKWCNQQWWRHALPQLFERLSCI